MSQDNPKIPKPTDPMIGQRLADEYLILDGLGEGGMATVYKARQEKVDRIVAIKMLKSNDPQLSQRFAREARTLAKLKHRNIVDAIDCLEIPPQSFLIMEYVDGIVLSNLIRDAGRIEKPEDIASIARQICDALDHAHHHKIIHRDMKPANIIMVEKDGEVIVKILDFGIAKVSDHMQKLTGQGQALGSPLYMSPEQCMGGELGPRSDLYSLGIVMYELITGSPPYNYPTVGQIMQAHCTPAVRPRPLAEMRPDLPGHQQLNQVLMRLMETDPDLRFENAAQVKKAIDFWITSVQQGQTGVALPKDLGLVKPDKKKEKEKEKEKQELAATKSQYASGKHQSQYVTPSATRPADVAKGKIILLGVSTLVFWVGILIAVHCGVHEQLYNLWLSTSLQVNALLTPPPPPEKPPEAKTEDNPSATSAKTSTPAQTPQELPKDTVLPALKDRHQMDVNDMTDSTGSGVMIIE